MIRLILILLAITTTELRAQFVSVKTGEHQGFTRVVVTLPQAYTWEFGRITSGYALRVRGSVADFDISTAFERIDRHRLTALEKLPADNALAFSLACNCHAIAQPFRPGIVIVDIADGPAPSNSPYEQTLTLTSSESTWQMRASLQRPMPRPRNFIEPPLLPVFGPRRLAERPNGNLIHENIRIPNARAAILGERLAREFSKGVASGAIAAEKLPKPTTLPTVNPVILDTLTDSAVTHNAPQIFTREPGFSPPLDPSQTGIECITDEALAVNKWGDDRAAYFQLSDARSNLIGEFDRPIPERVETLAKLYVYLGFGAETEALLTDLLPNAAQYQVLKDLAQAVDGQSGGKSFAGMEGCESPAALWAVLQLEKLPAQTNAASVLRAFSQLPIWLRNEIGPRLSVRFITAGDLPTAASLNALISRSRTSQLEQDYVRGKIDQAADKPNLAEPALETVARSKIALAGDARLSILEAKLDRGISITADEVTELSALLNENIDAEAAIDYRRTLARSLIATGDAKRAFHDIATREAQLFPILWADLVKRGSATDISELVLSPPPGAMRNLPDSTRQGLAKRLIDAGFPSESYPLIEGMLGPASDLLRAEAHLKLRDGRSALRHLAGNESPTAKLIRAESLEILGDYAAAEAIWRSMDQAQRGDRAQLLQHSWNALPPQSPDTLVSLAESLADTIDQPEAPLAHAQAQLSSTAILRQQALEVLREQTGL